MKKVLLMMLCAFLCGRALPAQDKLEMDPENGRVVREYEKNEISQSLESGDTTILTTKTWFTLKQIHLLPEPALALSSKEKFLLVQGEKIVLKKERIKIGGILPAGWMETYITKDSVEKVSSPVILSVLSVFVYFALLGGRVIERVWSGKNPDWALKSLWGTAIFACFAAFLWWFFGSPEEPLFLVWMFLSTSLLLSSALRVDDKKDVVTKNGLYRYNLISFCLMGLCAYTLSAPELWIASTAGQVVGFLAAKGIIAWRKRRKTLGSVAL